MFWNIFVVLLWIVVVVASKLVVLGTFYCNFVEVVVVVDVAVVVSIVSVVNNNGQLVDIWKAV